MHQFTIHTLVDITRHGNLRNNFPFETPAGDLIKDKETLRIARSQNANYNTMLQLLQIRGNILVEEEPVRTTEDLGYTKFGSFYEGTHNVWRLNFYTEQADIFARQSFPLGELESDFNIVPVLTECKETAFFPIKAFITVNMEHQNSQQKVVNALSGDIKNTYFTYGGFQNK